MALQFSQQAAYRLYKGCGFSEFSTENLYGSTLKLGRLVLLKASADCVPAL